MKALDCSTVRKRVGLGRDGASVLFTPGVDQDASSSAGPEASMRGHKFRNPRNPWKEKS